MPLCLFCHKPERNPTNTGMACWDLPDSPCMLASQILNERFGDDYFSRKAKDYLEAYEQAKRELEPKSRWVILLFDDDI